MLISAVKPHDNVALHANGLLYMMLWALQLCSALMFLSPVNVFVAW